MQAQVKHGQAEPINPNLIEEAFRRARDAPLNRDIDPDRLRAAIESEARLGVRDIYGLVAAAARVAKSGRAE